MANGDAASRRGIALTERCDLVCAALIEERWRRAPGLALRLSCADGGIVERPGRTRFDLQWLPSERQYAGPLRARWPSLPLSDASLSFVILDRLNMGSAENYLPLLDEVFRVLADDGRLMVVDTNPWGWLGMRARLAGQATGLAVDRLCVLLRKSGLEDIEIARALCWPPLPLALVERYADTLDRFGSRWLPLPGSLYTVSGRKRSSNVIAIPLARDRRHGLVAAPEGMRRAG